MTQPYTKIFPKIQEWCARQGATPLLDTYSGALKPFQLRCSCGRVFTGYWSNLQKPTALICCSICRIQYFKQRESQRLRASTLQAIQILFEGTGSTPDLSSYTHSQAPFRFLCKCGQEAYLRWAAIQQRVAFPLCPTCAEAERVRKIQEKCGPNGTAKRLRGPEHPRWKPELTEADRAPRRHHNKWYWSWVKAVFQRDNYTCVISGQVGGKLAAHHLYNWADYPEYRESLQNGVTITRELHVEFHRLYGKGRNTYDQFAEFYCIKTGHPYPIRDFTK